MFRRMTSKSHPAQNNANHPLLSAVVSDCIFGFLPTKDVLNCRLVCQQWKTASSNILRKRVTITFKTLEPSKFLEVFEKSDPVIGFQSFQFLDNVNRYSWDIEEIDTFFNKYGTNIKKLTFSTNCLKENKNHKGYYIAPLKSLDISPWILKAGNLQQLQLNSYWTGTKIEVQLTKLASVKFITVNECIISVGGALEGNIRIKPEQITLNYVKFLNRGICQNNLRLNDVIDFTQATEVNLHFAKTGTQFDMSEVLNTKCLRLGNLELTNWTAATGKVFFFYLHGCNFVQTNLLQIRRLHCAYSKVDFSVLPKTIKKLRFSESMKFTTGKTFDLPKLKYLRFDNPKDYEQISHFTQCWNLIEIQLSGGNWSYATVNLNVNLIPKSVKRMKLNANIIITNPNAEANIAQEIGVNKDYILNLDTLILEDYLHCLSSEVSQMMSIVKPKVLVVSRLDKERIINTTSICDFLLASQQLDKLIVGSPVDDLHHNNPFEKSVFSRFVGRKKADYYQFENNHKCENEDPVGKPLSYEEFRLCSKMNKLD